jgi:hypothetical protein
MPDRRKGMTLPGLITTCMTSGPALGTAGAPLAPATAAARAPRFDQALGG